MIKVLSRRNLFRFGSLGLVGSGPIGWGFLVERFRLAVERVKCPLRPRDSALEGLKIGVLSDFHFDETREVAFVKHCVAKMNAEKPDLIFLAGDFVTRNTKVMPELGGLLKPLSAPLGVYAVLGNHDYRWDHGKQVETHLQKAGVRVLRDQHVLLSRGGKTFAVAGTESVIVGKPDLSHALKGVPKETPVILGAHEPDFFDRSQKDSRVFLQLSGHTHGGQIRLPFFRPLYLPRYGQNYISGLYTRNQQHLYVTRGVGTIAIPARFACPPELTVLRLTA